MARKARTKAPTYTPEQVADLVRSFPMAPTIRSLRFCGEGASFCSYAVNETYLYRLATNRAATERLRWEERLLPLLQCRLMLEGRISSLSGPPPTATRSPSAA